MNENLPGTFPVVCIYEDDKGKSHLLDLDLPAMHRTPRPDGTSEFSGVCGATGFGVVAGDMPSLVDWHVSSQPGLSVVLSGQWEIETGSGERRVLTPGSVLLMLDNSGQGHRSHHAGADRSATIGINFDEETEATYRAILSDALESCSRVP